jgi:hypothetical protein
MPDAGCRPQQRGGQMANSQRRKPACFKDGAEESRSLSLINETAQVAR